MTTTAPDAPTINPWRRFPSDPQQFFSADEIAKAKSYVGPLRKLAAAGKAVALAGELAVVGLHVAPKLLSAFNVSNWVLRLAISALVVEAVGLVTSVGFAAYRELDYDKRWGFSTQTVRGFLSDLVKSLLVGLVISVMLFLPLWAIIRATELWWLFGWLAVSAVAVGIGVLAPVLIMPLFNKFTPLADAELRADLLALARQVDADVAEVQVSDASKRTRKDNAFVTGLGRTRRLVLFDNLLERPTAQIRSVAAHEIGHWKLRHILRSVPVSLALLLGTFVVLRVVLTQEAVLDFAGVDTLGDPAALPLFLLVFPIASAATGLVTAWLSRAHERQADIFALETTGDAEQFVEMIRGLYTGNLADLDPSWWRKLSESHPTAAERMALGTAWAAARR